MRIDVRVSPLRLRPDLPEDGAALRARLRAERAILGGAPLPRTSRLREAAAEMEMAKAGRRREGPERF